MVISDGAFEYTNDEQLWEANEVADLLLEDDQLRQDKKRRRPMSGFVVPKKEKEQPIKKRKIDTPVQDSNK